MQNMRIRNNILILLGLFLMVLPVVALAEGNSATYKAIEALKHFENKDGNIITVQPNDYLEVIKGKPNLAIWCEGDYPEGLCGIVDLSKHRLVVAALYRYIEPVTHNQTVYYLVTDSTEKIGIINDNFQISIPLSYPVSYPYIIYPNSVLGEDYLIGCSEPYCDAYLQRYPQATYYPNERPEHYLYVREGDRFGLMTFDNLPKQPLIYNRIDINSPSLNKRIRFEVTDDKGRNKFGYFNDKLDIAIAADFDQASRFSLGVANVKKNGKFGFIDGDGNTVIDFRFEKADGMSWRAGFTEPTAVVKWQGDPKLVGISGQYYDVNPTNTQPLSYHFGRAIIHNGQGKYSFVMANGELLAPFLFDKVENFNQYYDSKGTEIIASKVSQDGVDFVIDRFGQKLTQALPLEEKRPSRSGKEIYNSVCSTCHEAGLLRSPKFGDTQAWESKIAKGLTTLYDHAIHGYKAMPAKGGSDVSDEEVKNALDYMIKAVK